MKNLIWWALVLSAWLICSASAAAQDLDFWRKVAGRWEGTLEYSDYESGKRVKLKTVLIVSVAADNRTARFSYVYDDFGKIIKSEETHRVDRAAKKYRIGEDEFLFEETNGQIVLRGEQPDGERREPVRKTINFSADTLTILKETRTPFQFRNQYFFKRAAVSEPEKTLSPAQMTADFDVFKRALQQLHPGLYRYNTPVEIEKSFAETEAKIQTPLPEGEFFKLLAQMASLIRCGHTYPNPLNQTDAINRRLFARRIYFPFYFRLLDRRMIVTGNVSSKNLAAGSEITKINGVAIGNIIDALGSITTADGRNTMAARLKSLELKIARENQYLPFDIYYPLFFSVKDDIFEIEAIDYKTKKPTKFQVPAMTRAERFAETEKRYGKLPTYDDEWKFEIKENSLAILKIGNSLSWRLKKIDYKKFIADAFAEIQAKNIKNIIIDWRGNDGGDDEIYVEIIKYLARKTIPCADPKKRFVRGAQPDKDLSGYIEVYSKQIRQFLTDGVPANSVKKSNNGLFEILNDEPCVAIEPRADAFRGNAYVISDADNASAAYQFINAVKTNKLAKIVGEETGGNLQGINGDNYFLLRLPNSKFEIDIPVYFLSPLSSQPDSSVLPDYRIQTTADDIAAGTDAELNFIIQEIKRRAEAKN